MSQALLFTVRRRRARRRQQALLISHEALTLRRMPCCTPALGGEAPGLSFMARVVPGGRCAGSTCCTGYQPICQPCTTLGHRVEQQWPIEQVLSPYLAGRGSGGSEGHVRGEVRG